jgi:hypothetical protein
MFEEILSEQISAKERYRHEAEPPRGGISIRIMNNRIDTTMDGSGWVHPSRKQLYMKLIQNVLQKHMLKDCWININLNDHPISGCFNFARRIGHASEFLLPNHRFTTDDIQLLDGPNNTETYDDEVVLIRSRCQLFESKINKIYTSSIPQPSKIAYYRYAINHDFCTGYMWIGSVHGNSVADKDLIQTIEARGMAGKRFEPFIRHAEYKYVLYNDGNTLSDRMRLLLALNSVIIRKRSVYEEFYTYKLRHNENYIMYSDTEELDKIYQQLEGDHELCHKIILNNREFVDTVLTYTNILQYTADLINGIA